MTRTRSWHFGKLSLSPGIAPEIRPQSVAGRWQVVSLKSLGGHEEARASRPTPEYVRLGNLGQHPELMRGQSGRRVGSLFALKRDAAQEVHVVLAHDRISMPQGAGKKLNRLSVACAYGDQCGEQILLGIASVPGE